MSIPKGQGFPKNEYARFSPADSFHSEPYFSLVLVHTQVCATFPSSLPVGTQENTDQRPLQLDSGGPDGGTGVRAERI